MMLIPIGINAQGFNVSFRNDNAEKVLTILEKETGYDIVCQKEVLNTVRNKVNGHFTANTLSQLLDDVVCGQMSLGYDIVDKTIIIRPASKKAGNTHLDKTIKGVILDE